MGNLNFQDVIRDVHDPSNHALQISGTINAAGQATVTPLQAWPDPKTFIGLVTIAGGTIGASGNPTLNASPNYIGLTTSVIGNNPVIGAGVNGIGFATVAFSNSVGNATLNPGPNYIGLATVDMGVNKAWPDPKTYIGLVTVGHTVTVAAHALTASTVNIGSVSVLGGVISLQTSTLNIGSVSILGGKIVNDTSTLNIGSVSVLGGTINATLGASAAFVGLVTIANSVGNATLNPGPNYIGLATVDIGTNNTVRLGTNTLNVGSVSILGGGIGLNGGINGIGYVTTSPVQLSYYNQSSLVSGYIFHGFTNPGSNPTTANFRIQREVLNTGEVLFATGLPNFVNIWSAASLASISYS